jgi:hypothetical protein
MDLQHDPESAIRSNLVSMLDTMALRFRKGEIDKAEYTRTLNFLRFKIGEDLYDTYASLPPDGQGRTRST